MFIVTQTLYGVVEFADVGQSNAALVKTPLENDTAEPIVGELPVQLD